MTTAEALAKIAAIESDPANRTPPGSLWLYTAKARKKLDDLRRIVANNQRAERLARGEVVNDAGYSGRKTNRR